MAFRYKFNLEQTPSKSIASLLKNNYGDEESTKNAMRDIVQRYNIRDINNTIKLLTAELENGKMDKHTATILFDNLGYLQNFIQQKTPSSPLSGWIDDLNAVNNIKNEVINLMPKRF